MASLKLSHIYKVYDNGHKAVNDFSIDIADKEFIVFVGPSGCGKSTTLRMIAGLETITAGDLFIGDTLVNDMEPKDRDIAMVFQSYALYPHMTVYENMAFGLRNRHMPEAEIKKRVHEAAKILDIEDYLSRKPKAMSGGQRQRVALGRALVRNPKVFLLDEPLSNLDAKLRAQMRTEITKLHKSLETTFIYVTHDQIEAMTMGTRIVVMKLGYVQQIDTPMNLYNEPYNKFVAGFIGTPQMNFFNVSLLREDGNVKLTFVDAPINKEAVENGKESQYVYPKISIPYEKVSKIHDKYLHDDKRVFFGIRPEHLRVVKEGEGIKVVVEAVEHLGNECIVYGRIGDHITEFSMKDDGTAIIVKVLEGSNIAVGDIIEVMPDVDKVHFFDHETEITLMEKIPSFNSIHASISANKLNVFGGKVSVPEVFKEILGDRKACTLEIPPSAIVPGNDFKLKVLKSEKINGKYLLHLINGDSFLFALSDEKIENGAEYEFSLVNEKISIVSEDTSEPNELLAPISDNIELIGTFSKKEIKENRQRNIQFYYDIHGYSVEAPVENGYKINTIDGNDCYKKKYKYYIKRNKAKLVSNAEEGIKASVEKVLNYGNAIYAKVRAEDDVFLITVDKDFDAKEVNIQFDSSDIEVYSTDIDMKIC